MPVIAGRALLLLLLLALLGGATPAIVLGALIVTDRVSVPGTRLRPHDETGASSAAQAAYVQWGNGFGSVAVVFPTPGRYSFTLHASLDHDGAAVPALTEMRLDQLPLAFGATYAQDIVAAPADYTWITDVAAGPHEIAIAVMNRDRPGLASLLVQTLEIRSQGPSGRPPEPPGTRDPTRQPFSSYSLWNTALGAGARWSAPTDADTRDLRRANGTIAAGEWSIPVYEGTATDPVVPVRVTDNLYPMAALALHLPAGAAPAPPAKGGDHHMAVFDPDKAHLTHLFGCHRDGRGFTCDLGQRDSVCGDGLGDYGWGSGVIRKWEIETGAIHHVLRYSLATSATKAGSSWVSGLAWPAMRSDYGGPTDYTGHVLYGSTVGIPATVDLAALGLSGPGLVLAHALQDYGAVQRDTGGDHGINFYAEEAAEGLSALDAMRADLGKIIPHLSILRNQAPDSAGGGGARRQPTLPGIDKAVCP